MRIRPLVLAIAAGAMSIVMAGSSHAEIWLEDPTTGCEVLSDGDKKG